MTLLNEALEFKKLDVRLVERNLSRGVISQEILDSEVAQLPDDSEHGEWVSLSAFIEGETIPANGHGRSLSDLG